MNELVHIVRRALVTDQLLTTELNFKILHFISYSELFSFFIMQFYTHLLINSFQFVRKLRKVMASWMINDGVFNTVSCWKNCFCSSTQHLYRQICGMTVVL